jgi:hypothetical protein
MLNPKGLNYYPELVFVKRRKSANRMKRLQFAFPKAKFFAVQTGHTLTAESAGRAKALVSAYKLNKSVKYSDAPPYPSKAFYEAKLWQFCRKQVLKPLSEFCSLKSRILPTW